MASGKGKSHDLSAFSGRKSSKTQFIQRKEGLDSESRRILYHVFQPGVDDETARDKELDLTTLSTHIDATLSTAHAKCDSASARASDDTPSEDIGRILGGESVSFDISGNSGTLVIEADRLGVASHSNFSTIRANCCVYKGKWVYELMLGSKGVIQVGWATLACRFSQEEGVGDTQDSYAYDGNRIRKWNVKTLKYGEPWLTGDVISCAMDCDRGTVTFARSVALHLLERFRSFQPRKKILISLGWKI